MAAPRIDVSLPRLLYVGDVPVEHTVAGAALLYRLFDGYPADRLVVYQSDLPAVRSPERRLPGVAYREFSLGSTRLLYSRLSGYYGGLVLQRAARRAGPLTAPARVDAPDAVVTVAHAFSWLTAATLAGRLGVPLHLIVHDDCLVTMALAAPLERWADAQFGRVYRAAASRFCISPAMRDYYSERYGAGSLVLYPSRARDALVHDAPPPREFAAGAPFTVAFAGTLSAGHLPAVEALACVLGGIGGRLDLYGARLAPDATARLSSPVVRFHEFRPFEELSDVLRATADVLWLPMSFDAADARNMALCFPTKLADYTALGLPILVVGPSYGSAVTWARDNPGSAAVVTDLAGGELSRVVTALSEGAGLRHRLAAEAVRLGAQWFGHDQAQRRFLAGIGAGEASGA